MKIPKRIIVAVASVITAISSLNIIADATTVTISDSLTPKVSQNSAGTEIYYAYYLNNGTQVNLENGVTLSGSYQGYIQCYALAAFTYKGKFNKQLADTGYYDMGWSSSEDYIYLTARSAKKIFSSIPVGSHVRINTANGNQHSITPVKTTSSNITIYDANISYDNVISKRTNTYSQFVTNYPRLDYISNGTGSKGSNTSIGSGIQKDSYYSRYMFSPYSGVTLSYNINLTAGTIKASFNYDNTPDNDNNAQKRIDLYYECKNSSTGQANTFSSSDENSNKQQSYQHTFSLTQSQKQNLQYLDLAMSIGSSCVYSPYWVKCW